jgi:hypothetical protein
MRIVDVKARLPGLKAPALLTTLEWDTGPVRVTYAKTPEIAQDFQRVKNIERDGGVKTLADGSAYLDALLAFYSGAYCWAEERKGGQ